jgi:hypothetical protein
MSPNATMTTELGQVPNDLIVLEKPLKKALTEMEFYEYTDSQRIRQLINSGMLQTRWEDRTSNWKSLWENEQDQLNQYRKLAKNGLVKVSYRMEGCSPRMR